MLHESEAFQVLFSPICGAYNEYELAGHKAVLLGSPHPEI